MSALSLVLLIVGAVGIFAAIFWRPAFGAALILALVHFERELMFYGHSAVKLISIICLGVLIVRVLATGKKIRFDMTTWLIVFFMQWVAITTFWSSDQSEIPSDLVSLVLQSMMYFLMVNLVMSKADLKLALWGHVIGGTILAIILITTMVNQNFLRDTEIVGLGLNLAARMVGLNLLLAILLSQLEKGYFARIVLIGVAILSGAGSILSLSRGNWYGLALSAVVLIIIMSIKKNYQFTFKQVFLIIAVGYLALYSASTFLLSEHGLSKLGDRFESAYTFSDGASGRFDIWIAAWDAFTEKPLFGYGFNSFERENQWNHKSAHNAFVLIVVESGLVGLFLFFLILGSLLKKLGYLLLDKNSNTIALGWGMALLTFLVTVSSVDSAIDRKYFWFVLGLISLLIQHYGLTQPLEETTAEYEAVTKIEAANQFV